MTIPTNYLPENFIKGQIENILNVMPDPITYSSSPLKLIHESHVSQSDESAIYQWVIQVAESKSDLLENFISARTEELVLIEPTSKEIMDELGWKHIFTQLDVPNSNKVIWSNNDSYTLLIQETDNSIIIIYIQSGQY